MCTKTIDLICTYNKVFVTYQTQGGVNPKTYPLVYELAHC